MPKAKYQKDKASNLYYAYEKTGMYKPDGTPEYKKFRAKTVAKLDEKIKEYQATAALGVEVTTITVDEWYKKWFDVYKSSCRQNTQNFYKGLYTVHIKPAIGQMRISQVRQIHCQKILSEKSETHTEKTVSHIRGVLYGLFEKAVENQIIPINPAAHLKVEGLEGRKRRDLTADERKKYLGACLTHPFGSFAAVLYFYGLRRGEALALTKNDVFTNAIRINKQYTFPHNTYPVLGDPKSDAGFRTITTPKKAKNYLDFSEYGDNELLFSDDDGNPLDHAAITKMWESFITAALGADTDITMHCLRHNYCTMLFEHGTDVMTAAEMMGHDDIQTTMNIYSHYSEKMKKKGTAKILKIG